MLPLSTLSAVALLAGTALASPYNVRSSNGFVVKLEGPASSVYSIDDLVFTAHVTNTGPDAVKVFRFNTVLDTLLTRSFDVKKDGKDVPFTGIKVSVRLDDSSYQSIASGETVSATHHLASLYDFASVGNGTFSFTPITSFQFAGVGGVNGHPSSLVSVPANQIHVTVVGDVSHREHPNDKRSVVNPICDDGFPEFAFIGDSYTEAKALAKIASDYIKNNGPTDPLYLAYFKDNVGSAVTAVLDKVANENDGSRTLNCRDPYHQCWPYTSTGVIAYTALLPAPSTSSDIFYCGVFYDEVTTNRLCSDTTVDDRNIRGGTTLHELTHATSRTTDVIYGCPNDIALSAADSLRNADNYNCFATQVFKNTQCPNIDP